MNTLAAILLWFLLQITLLAVATGLVYVIMRRFGSSLRGMVVLTGLVTATCLIPLAVLPWPNWELPRFRGNEPRMASRETPEEVEPIAALNAQRNIDPVHLEPPEEITWGTQWNYFVDAIQHPRPVEAERVEMVADSPVQPTDDVSSDFSWLQIALGVLVVCWVLGLVRFVAGGWSVRRLVRSARPIHSRALEETVEVLRAELAITRPVVLRESSRNRTAATTGWRHPVVLLPADWTDWTPEQRRAVLAHEMAHIARRDYLVACIVQLALIFHFYHPLWHWLVRRLRLEQELAADALAASITGGREVYLRNLADLALRRSEAVRPLAWPARAFLPSRHMFLRRIEMLRDPKMAADRRSPMLKTLSLVILLGIGVVISGIRPDAALAQNETVVDEPVKALGDDERVVGTEEAAEKVSTTELITYIPSEAVAMVSVRLQEVLSSPLMAERADEFRELLDTRFISRDPILKDAGVTSSTVDHFLSAEPGNGSGGSIVVLHTSRPIQQSKLIEKAAAGIPILGGVVYEVQGLGTVAFPDDRTLIIGPDRNSVSRMFLSSQIPNSTSPWHRMAVDLGQPPVLISCNAEKILPAVEHQVAQGDSMLAALLPILQNMKVGSFGIRVDDEIEIVGLGECADSKASERAAETIKAIVRLGQGTVGQFAESLKQQNRSEPTDERTLHIEALQHAQTMLSRVEVKTEQSNVRFRTSGLDVDSVSGLLLPAIQQARVAAYRDQSKNNLKQLALAFHNYHDVYGFFPPAVIEENGVKRSWRVEVLPFVEGAALYEQYRKDEPWDSEHNQKILEQMPPVFRDPLDTSDVYSTSYYVLTSDFDLGEGVDAAEMGMGMGMFAEGEGGLEGGLGPAQEAGEESPKDEKDQSKPEKDDPIIPGADWPVFSSRPIDTRSGKKGVSMMNVSDGTSATIMIVEARRNVPWTKPEDIPFDVNKLKQLRDKDLGGNQPGGFLAAFCDGSVHFISTAVALSTLKLLITMQDGTPVPEDWRGEN